MKYVVLKEFLDRFDNKRHCHPGESHKPPTEERAQQLIDLGFIAAVKKEEPLEEPVETQGEAETVKPLKGNKKSKNKAADAE